MKNQLFTAAKTAREKAYSPYSTFKVGAAIELENGKIYSGTNIENASYGGTACAERVAIWKGISEDGAQKIKEVCVVTPSGWPPCGMCRQVIAEFATPNTLIHVCDLNSVIKTYKMLELLPEAFMPEHLK
jgi:cytidine deaminase